MFAWDKHIKIWQLVGALLAIPAGIAGTYSVYSNYISGGVSCGELRSSIISVLDKNLAADVKRTLLREDVERFEKYCGDQDPDAKVIFQAAVTPPTAAQPAPKAVGTPQPGAIFGLSRTGERRGWVNLMRRTPEGNSEPAFDGAPIAMRSLPPAGAVLTARVLVAVWLAAPPPGQVNDAAQLQGRIAAGGCVKILSSGPPGRPFWAEVAPEPCPKTD